MIPQADAARLQAAIIAGHAPEDHLLELRIFADGPRGSEWFPVREYARAAARAITLAACAEVYIGAAPRTRRRGRAEDVDRLYCVWADCDTPESVERLRAFRPLPNIVNRSGTAGRLHAWWQLVGSSVTAAQGVRANRRLALALGADRASTDAARIMRLAGTRNHKMSPPASVECVRLEFDTYTIADVIGGLPDDPVYTAPRAVQPQREHTGGSIEGIVRCVRDAPVGERNTVLYWAACRCAEEGHDTPPLLAAAMDAGLSETEALRTIESAQRTAA